MTGTQEVHLSKYIPLVIPAQAGIQSGYLPPCLGMFLLKNVLVPISHYETILQRIAIFMTGFPPARE